MTSSTPKPTAKPTMPPRYFRDTDLATLTIAQGFKVLGAKSEDYSGSSVASAGDVNGDGYADIIIGASDADPYSRWEAGTSYVIFGKPSGFSDIDLVNLTSTQGFKILGAASQDYSGMSVASAGDVNGDRYADIIIGAPCADPYSRLYAGTSYVIFGKPSGFMDIDLEKFTSGTNGFKILGAASEDYSGFSVASAGDVNGDTKADIIIGAYKARTEAGTSYVIFGKTSDFDFIDIDLAKFTSGTNGFKILGAASGDWSGFSVASAGDVNGDTKADIIIGAYQADPYSRLDAGTSYVIFGKESGFTDIDLAKFTSGTNGFKILGAASSDWSGSSVASAGDVNGDSYADVIIGANRARSYAGTSYVIFGKPSGFMDIDLEKFTSGTNGFKILGAASGDWSGSSVASAGDVNGDGYADIIIGASDADPNSKDRAGTSYVIFGKLSGFIDIDLSMLTSSQGFKILGAASKDYSGSSVASAGDVNGDGYADIIIGASDADPNSRLDAGTSYVITDVMATFSPTPIPTIIPTYSPSLKPSVIPSLFPIMMPVSDLTTSPISFTKSPILAPTGNPTDIKEVSGSYGPKPLHDRLTFKWATSAASGGMSLLAAWIFREKIAFYIIDNWGYSYKLLYDDNKKIILPIGEIGLRLAKSKDGVSDVLVCKIKDIYTLVEIDNGNNNGISEGLYDTIFEKLTAQQFDNFALLESEKNQIRDFLLSHKFIDFEELGYIRGNIYKLFLDNYKIAHKEKHSGITRKAQDAFRLSDDNPLHDNIDTETGKNGVEMRPSGSDKVFVLTTENKQISSTQMDLKTTTDNDHVILSLSNIKYNNNLLNHPQALEILKISKEIAGKEFSNLLIDISKDIHFFNMFEENIKEKGIEDTIVTLLKANGKIENANTETTVYQNPIFTDITNMLSLLSAKQILYNLPLMHYVAQNTLNYLSYNITLPNLSDNKAALISVDLVLGNLAAQYLPAESVMNGLFISTASTASYAVKLIAVDCIKNQEPSEGPIEFAMQCASTIAAHSLPGVVNYALTKAILPDAKISISTLDMLGSSSFGVVQCYNNYKAVYGGETQASTTDIVVPYIADAITLWSLRGYLNFDTSNTANLMTGVKNAMSVAATVYATDCVARITMDIVSQEMKEEYVDPMFNYVTEVYNYSVNSINQIVGAIENN